MSKPPLVITYYTEETAYQLEVLGLIASCEKHGVEIHVTALPSLGSWESNCAMKPRFIRDKLLEHQRSVFWVDADALFRKTPDFDWLSACDVSVLEIMECPDPRLRYRAGSIFVNYTEQGIRFANEWVEYCQGKIDRNEEIAYLDQYSLCEVLADRPEMKMLRLPLSYCKVFDDQTTLSEKDVVIEMFQASRRLREWV